MCVPTEIRNAKTEVFLETTYAEITVKSTQFRVKIREFKRYVSQVGTATYLVSSPIQFGQKIRDTKNVSKNSRHDFR